MKILKFISKNMSENVKTTVKATKKTSETKTGENNVVFCLFGNTAL